MARLTLAAIVAAASVAAAPTAALAATCTTALTYPGDGAPRDSIAAWMATGAGAVGLPGELPVMGALVESDLRNLNFGDEDRLGYFQMRRSIWDFGPYGGFFANPSLQLLWFTDIAKLAGERRTAAGIDNADPNTWGEWDADVLLPPAQFRGRYQLRLSEAQSLIVAGCPPLGDTTAPEVALDGTPRWAPRSGVAIVRVRCVSEACRLEAGGVARIRGRGREFRLGRASRFAAQDETADLRLRVPRAVRRAIRRGRSVRAVITVTARVAAGNGAVIRRTLRLRRP
jgi:hypothetical protein